MSSKKKDKKGPKPVRVNPEAHLPKIKPKPVNWSGPRELLEQARQFPLFGCWIDAGWQEAALAQVVVARVSEPGRVLYGFFLVDYFLLGVKDCHWKADLSSASFEKHLPILGTPERASPDLAHTLIYGGVDYARRWGFEPHSDFNEVVLVLDPPGTHRRDPHVQFGNNGKPFYISGPHDNVSRILATLKYTAGEGNYDVLINPEAL